MAEADAISAMEACIADIQTWMLSDKLKLNSAKTEFLIIATRQQLEKVEVTQLQVGCSSIKPSATAVRNLGASRSTHDLICWTTSIKLVVRHFIIFITSVELGNIYRVR